MKQQQIIGIDVSKNTLDCCFLSNTGSEFLKIENNLKGFKLLEKWLLKTHQIKYCEMLFCMEHTGLYNLPLLNFLKNKNTSIWIESAIHIKRSMGLVRGKNDKIDAERIAQYASKNIENVNLWQPKRVVVEKVKALLTLRENILSQIKQINVPMNEYKAYGNKEIAIMLNKHTNPIDKILRKQIAKIEVEINELILEDEALNQLFKILTSIPGIGKVTAWMFIIHTHEFKMFSSARSLACHSGVAPFECSSGLMKGKAKVSHLANKKLKTALHMASLTAVKYDIELQLYYNKKVAEGKNKMSVLNAVRNKIVHRIFACQKNDRLYVKKIV
jgi:transposase